jgi:predicted nuclease with RNAse H fold
MPVERMQHGGAVETGLRPTRGVGVTELLQMAGEYTGKTYPRSKRSLGIAMADLDRISQDKTLDQIGDVREVNAVLGGPAADV